MDDTVTNDRVEAEGGFVDLVAGKLRRSMQKCTEIGEEVLRRVLGDECTPELQEQLRTKILMDSIAREVVTWYFRGTLGWAQMNRKKKKPDNNSPAMKGGRKFIRKPG